MFMLSKLFTNGNLFVPRVFRVGWIGGKDLNTKVCVIPLKCVIRSAHPAKRVYNSKWKETYGG